MIAYKGFNKDLTCNRGKGTFQYEIGKTYTEDTAKCASTGFHCCAEPIEVLRWYPTGRYCIVKAEGDINEDGHNRVSCTKMTVLKEITKEQLAALECEWIAKHPEVANSSEVKKDKGFAKDVVIVRGKKPCAAGEMGATICLVREKWRSCEIKDLAIYKIDGVFYRPGIYYDVEGRRSL